jgi:hypothetical protein
MTLFPLEVRFVRLKPQLINFRKQPRSLALVNKGGRGWVYVNGRPFVSYAIEIANTGSWEPE